MNAHRFKLSAPCLIAVMVGLMACEGSLSVEEEGGAQGGGVDTPPGGSRGGPDAGFHDGGPVASLPDGGVAGQGEMGGVELKPCRTPEAVFQREVWPKVAKPICSGCHVSQGVAEQQGARFVLKDESSVSSGEFNLEGFFAYNLEQFRDLSSGKTPLFLSKALGESHQGGAVVGEGSVEHEALLELERSFEQEGEQEQCEAIEPVDPLSELEQLDAARTLRKATMMLSGRLPTQEERARLGGAADQEVELEAILRQEVMRGPGFYSWLKYAWNEILNLRGAWELDVNRTFEVVSQQDYRARGWAFLNVAGSPDCDSFWSGDASMELWERFGYDAIETCKDSTYRNNYLSQRVAWSLIEEPLELIAWVIATDRSFGEILTSEAVMMNYYSSIAYYGSAQPEENAYIAQYGQGLELETIEHPGGSVIESVEVPKLHAFKPMESTRRSRQRRDDQEELEFFYYNEDAEDIPRSGLLTSQIYLNRYPTTDTNLNRHRAWSYFLNFLGVDILALADFRGDPAEAELNSDQPTIDDANCNVCHTVMDPIAGLFQDFGDDGRWQPNAAWPTRKQPNMFPPGSSIVGPKPNTPFTEAMAQQLAPIQWLGEQTVQDARFAPRMVRHAFVQLTGHEPLALPLDTDKPGWQGRRAAYEAQSALLSEITQGFVARDLDMKWVLIQIVLSPWYRASGLSDPQAARTPDRVESVAGFGSGDQLLTPEALLRKIEAILERPWPHRGYKMKGNRLNVVDADAVSNDYLLRFNTHNDFEYIDPIFRDMYGGVDFYNNTERLERPSSVMAAVGRRVAYELGCASVASEFALVPAERALFSEVSQRDTLEQNEQGVRRTVEHLMERMWGSSSEEDLDQAVALFDEVQRQGALRVAAGELLPELLEHCRATEKLAGQRGAFTAVERDELYTLRAWSAVVSYLALDPKFLYTW